jgi:long-subunit acyl-CoA synthetase (AMP-forming)
VSPANPAYNASELAYQLKDSKSVALITSSSLLGTALKAIESTPTISREQIFLIDVEDHPSHKTVEQLIRKARKGLPLPRLKMKPGEGKTRLAFISYSSGTTGLPKGVMISHYNVIANVLQLTLHSKEFDNQSREITLTLLPLYHIYGTFLNNFKSYRMFTKCRSCVCPPWRIVPG